MSIKPTLSFFRNTNALHIVSLFDCGAGFFEPAEPPINRKPVTAPQSFPEVMLRKTVVMDERLHYSAFVQDVLDTQRYS